MREDNGVDHADMLELVKWIAKYGSADKLLREHRPVHGRCPCCRSLGCTLFAAARQAKMVRPSS
jgi:hypothetical protein